MFQNRGVKLRYTVGQNNQLGQSRGPDFIFIGVKVRPHFAISAAATLCDVAFVNIVCCETKLLFISSTFWRFCFVSRSLFLSWCFVSQCFLMLYSFITATLAPHTRQTGQSFTVVNRYSVSHLSRNLLFSAFRLAGFWKGCLTTARGDWQHEVEN